MIWKEANNFNFKKKKIKDLKIYLGSSCSTGLYKKRRGKILYDMTKVTF